MSYLTVKNLTRVFDLSDPLLVRLLSGTPRRELTAVDNVSFSVEAGTTYALVGESGSGKSTIAKMAVGLLDPTSGSISIDGQPMTTDSGTELRRRVQMVFQSPYASLNPRWKTGDIIAEPLRAFGLVKDRMQQVDRVVDLLEKVGLSETDMNRYPHEFSGGQRQRISIARALASEPQMIVCDEPTSALDVSVQAQVLNLLKKLQRELGLTYLFITHDLAVVSTIANRVGVLKNGQLVEEGPTAKLFASPQTDYTKMLLDSVPSVESIRT